MANSVEPKVEVTKDEADKGQFDATRLVNEDPNKKYRWARKKDINVARHQFNGYEVVDKKTDNVRSVLDETTRMKKPEDTTTSIEVSDMILMSIPKDRYEQILKQRSEKIHRTTRGVAATFKAEVGRIAGPGNAYEEHTDNNAMRGMSSDAYDRMQEEARHERRK